MSIIFTVIDPATDKEQLKAKGTVKSVVVKRINQDGSPKVTPITKGPNKGKNIVSTHRYSLWLTDGEKDVRIDLGTGEVKQLKYENQLQIKVGSEYKTITPGAEISIYPVIESNFENKETGGTVENYQAKRTAITLIKEGSVPSNTDSSTESHTGVNSGGFKVYGEVTDVNGNEVTVQDEKKGTVKVTVSDDQRKELSVGVRMTGFIQDSVVVNNFKVYTSSGGKQEKDDLPIRLGNAITITQIICPETPLEKNLEMVTSIIKVMDETRIKLKAAYPNMPDYNLGARLGQMGIVSAPYCSSDAELEAEVIKNFGLVTKLEEDLRKQSTKEKEVTPPATKVKKAKKEDIPTIEEDLVDPDSYDDSPLDFDDDIPF